MILKATLFRLLLIILYTNTEGRPQSVLDPEPVEKEEPELPAKIESALAQAKVQNPRIEAYTSGSDNEDEFPLPLNQVPPTGPEPVEKQAPEVPTKIENAATEMKKLAAKAKPEPSPSSEAGRKIHKSKPIEVVHGVVVQRPPKPKPESVKPITPEIESPVQPLQTDPEENLPKPIDLKFPLLPQHPERDGSDPHDEPVPGLEASPLKSPTTTLTGDELDETVQIHGSWVDGGDFSLPLLKPMDNNLNDEVDATATEKIFIMKASQGDEGGKPSQVISHLIKIGDGSTDSKFQKINEEIDRRQEEHAKHGLTGRERYEIFVNDGHMTIGRSKDGKKVYQYFGPIEITPVNEHDERGETTHLEEHIDNLAHASGNHPGSHKGSKSDLGNYIKVIFTDIHGLRRVDKRKPKPKPRAYVLGTGGHEKGRWSSSLAIAGSTSISGDKHGSVSGANAQDASPNSRTRADASAMVWQGGSEAISQGSADSMDFHGSKPKCLNPPCRANNAKAISFAEQFDKDAKSVLSSKMVPDEGQGDPSVSTGKERKKVAGAPSTSNKNGQSRSLGSKNKAKGSPKGIGAMSGPLP